MPTRSRRVAARLEGLLLRHPPDSQGLHDLRADRLHRVQGRQGVLEDVAHVVAADIPQMLLGSLEQVHAVEPDLTFDDGRREQSEDREGGDRLTRTGLAHDSDPLAMTDAEPKAVHGADESLGRREADGEVPHIEK